MSRHLYIDASPPPYNGPRDRLDKEAFRKSFSVLGARVSPEKTGVFLKAPALKDCIMDLPKIRTVVSGPSASDGERLVLLRVPNQADIPPEAREFLDREAKGFVNHEIELDYDYWTADECLHAFLPEGLRDGAPNGFAMTGHIAHVNLLDEYLPYKHIIGQLIMDVGDSHSSNVVRLIAFQQKNKRVKTVVNKLDTIDNQFRFFKMELIAGEPDFVVEHHEADCRFTFDFTQVYWNSRLHTEHERLVEMFKPEELVADVFAGVGPFAVPAAKKGCAVLANDLNPNSAKYLRKNVDDNRVTELVRVSCEDGRDFIRASVSRVFDEPFPAYTGPKPSRMQEERDRKRLQKFAAEGKLVPVPDTVEMRKPLRRAIAHFVMNLPDSAITFLDAFKGILADDSRNLSGAYEQMPMVHCHCFTRELDIARAEEDIRQRVEEKLGHPLGNEISLHLAGVNPARKNFTFALPAPPSASLIMSDESKVLPTVHADSDGSSSITKSALDTVRTAVAIPENELKRWRRTFDNNAKVVNGEKFLDPESFVNAIAPKADLTKKIGREQFAILFRIADTSRRGLVSWDDFTVFETLLKRPDADYWMAFQYFDVDHSGYIDYNEFKTVFSANLRPDAIPFDFDCDWIKLYLGKKNGTHVLGYNEFTQLMKGLQGERLRQAFKYLDKDQDGFIRPEEFKRIILEIAGHKLSDTVIDRLPTLCTLTPGQRISYSEVIAFHNVIREMDMVERIIREATAKSKDGRIDQTDFLNHAASSSRYSLFTPMEASIIFHFAGRGIGTQRLALLDFGQLLDPRWKPPHEHVVEQKPSSPVSLLHDILHSAYNFGLGGIAGAVGATIVYPIDMVKTRMQNQRSTVVGQMLYKNSIDCAKKIFRNEGFLGFYRGLGPQLVATPEKAIKLTVNDLVRSRAMDPETGRIKVFWELVAGGTAGGSQVIFTNPLEIVKIRLQVQGEAAKVEGATPKGAIHIIRQLGILGLYKGSSACLLRDIPFSAIYFTAYSHLKSDVFQEGYNGKKLSFLETLAAAGIAGMPAAYLTTPADVVKTRLQVEARKGQTHYSGLRDAFVKIYREEGFRALFKGGPARVIRSSPQFGFTLLAYETLKDVLPYPWQDKPIKVETALTSRPDDLAKIRARNALKILLDVHGDFGTRAAAFSGKPLSLSNPRLSSS
ncbi:hypothetical protein NLJ89_g229 [Agrocybe chaxingu]|uniref:tRNA (guanine(37)-N1)-methyltransferase n=1 Tax=Agrocybe chaxingu TaxID=84603 RepID=A0A9W8N2C1_9AGAR|nr:hypothetical protein NLJ89_g229 [Agrocybe chaxingu]